MASGLWYVAMASLDGFVEDREGGFGWAAPDDEVHAFVNDLVRPVGTHLYGRRMYETMAAWETDASLAEGSAVTRDFSEVWRGADKVVFSTTLARVVTSRTVLERHFDADAVRNRKADATAPLAVAGPALATHALRAGLVDEYLLLIAPVVVGGGKAALPADLRLDLELVDERRFTTSGFVHLRYRVLPSGHR